MPPPPPPPPPGPPPSGPPPPPTFNQAPKIKKSEASNRNALLGSIENFKSTGLKKTKHLMVDKSAPLVSASNSTGTGGGAAGGSPRVGSATVGRVGGSRMQPPQGLGGLFADGMPQLRPTGNRFGSNTNIGNTGSSSPRQPVSGAAARFGNQPAFSDARFKRHPSSPDIHSVSENAGANRGTHSYDQQLSSASNRTAGNVKKWPAVNSGHDSSSSSRSANNGHLNNHFGGQQKQSAIPPPLPSSANRPSISKFSHAQTNSGNTQSTGNSIHTGGQPSLPVKKHSFVGGADRPLPPTPVTGPGTGRGAHGPPPPPARTEQTNLRRKSSVGGASNDSGSGARHGSSGGMSNVANRPLPPTPAPSTGSRGLAPGPPSGPTTTTTTTGSWRPPALPARSSPHWQPSPIPASQTNTGPGVRPSRAPGGAPPPPPAREPSGGPPPPPPPRVDKSSEYNSTFETQFRFPDIDTLPPPEPFSNKAKTYPSKNQKNQAARGSVAGGRTSAAN